MPKTIEELKAEIKAEIQRGISESLDLLKNRITILENMHRKGEYGQTNDGKHKTFIKS
jgi:uncharacterized protein YjgD (DUF1641 family)